MDIASLLNRPPPAPRAVSPPPDTESSSFDAGRTAPYTLKEDLTIVKSVAAYFGSSFSGRIPWSFWETYKRASGSRRSNSSLYHHWNGALTRKYESFIASGRLEECITLLETAIAPERGSDFRPAGAPLRQQRSEPAVPLGVQMQTREASQRARIESQADTPCASQLPPHISMKPPSPE
jgi:hypothetical protein